MFLKWRNLGKIHIIVINKIKSIFIENILVILFITVSIFFLIDYLDISAEYERPEVDRSPDAFSYLDEGIHLRNVSYDFREIINRNRTPGLPLVVSFLAQNKGSLIRNSD